MPPDDAPKFDDLYPRLTLRLSKRARAGLKSLAKASTPKLKLGTYCRHILEEHARKMAALEKEKAA